jgi:hypothetical protein
MIPLHVFFVVAAAAFAAAAAVGIAGFGAAITFQVIWVTADIAGVSDTGSLET